MCGRMISWALCASAVVGLLASRVEAQGARRVKIVRGPALAEAAAYQAAPSPQVDQLQEQVADQWSPEADASESSPFDDTSSDWSTEGSDGCADASCDLAGGCARCAPYGLAAGVEATYLKPGFEDSNPGLNFTNDFDAEAAPRIWLQWRNQNGWGLRARYWDFDAEQQRTAAGDFGDTLAAQFSADNLELYAVDLELTRNFALGGIECCASLGARNGRFHSFQTLDLTIFDLAGGGGDDASVILQEIDRDLNGTGITTSLDLRRPFLDSRLALICNLRGSVLWGGNDLTQNLTVIEVVPVGVGDLDLNDFQQLSFFGSNGSGMWIGEIQAGGEWNAPLSNAVGCGNAFLRVLFEAQWWNLPGVTSDGGNSTNSQLYDFVGITAAAGFTR